MDTKITRANDLKGFHQLGSYGSLLGVISGGKTLEVSRRKWTVRKDLCGLAG